jgi:hypothetical protein
MAKKQTRKDGYVNMQCRLCSNVVERVDSNAKTVICWQCTHLGAEGYSESEIKDLTIQERNRIFVK